VGAGEQWMWDIMAVLMWQGRVDGYYSSVWTLTGSPYAYHIGSMNFNFESRAQCMNTRRLVADCLDSRVF